MADDHEGRVGDACGGAIDVATEPPRLYWRLDDAADVSPTVTAPDERHRRFELTGETGLVGEQPPLVYRFDYSAAIAE
jgi:hypothetical protein